jgi:hypothetical protein
VEGPQVSIVPRLWLPRVIDSSNRRLDLSFAGAATVHADIALGTYLTPEDLAAAIQTAAVAVEATSTCVFSSTTGKFTVGRTGKTVQVKATGTAQTLLGWLGTSAAVADAQTADYQAQGYWSPGYPVRFDSWDVPIVTEGFSRSLSGVSREVIHADLVNRRLSFELVDGYKAKEILETTHVNESFESVWRGAKQRFRWWADITDLATWGDYFLLSPRDTWDPERMRPGRDYYRFDLDFGGYVA